MNKQLILDNVTVKYDALAAVSDATFSLAEGEIGCLLGPSGCGKTTLLRAIAGFEPLTSGTISLHGEHISTAQQTQAPEERAVGMVFQDFALFPHLNVRDNIAFGLSELSSGEKTQRVLEMLESSRFSERCRPLSTRIIWRTTAACRTGKSASAQPSNFITR